MKKGKKELLKEAALVCFAINGIRATRVEDITNRAGVAKGTFYHYFKDKADIAEEMLNEGFERYSEFIQDVVEMDISLEDKLRRCIERRIEQYNEDGRKLLMIIKLHERGEFALLSEKVFKTKLNEVDPMCKLLESGREEIEEEYHPYLEEIAKTISTAMFFFKDFHIKKKIGPIDTEEEYERFFNSKIKLDNTQVTNIFYKMFVKSILKS